MFAFIETIVLRPLWSAIQKELIKQAGYQFDKFLSKFRGLLSATLDDIIDCIKVPSEERARLFVTAGRDFVINESKDTKVEFRSIPLAALSNSADLKSCLSQKLYKNIELEALRNSLDISDQDWLAMVDQYTEVVLKHGLKYALKRSIKKHQELSSGDYLVTIENEAYVVDGESRYRDMLKLYSPELGTQLADIYSKMTGGVSRGVSKELSMAKKIWDSRLRGGYTYKKGTFSSSE